MIQTFVVSSARSGDWSDGQTRYVSVARGLTR